MPTYMIAEWHLLHYHHIFISTKKQTNKQTPTKTNKTKQKSIMCPTFKTACPPIPTIIVPTPATANILTFHAHATLSLLSPNKNTVVH